MTLVTTGVLPKLTSPELVVAVARAAHGEALELIAAGDMPKYYLDSEIYVPGVKKEVESSASYVEVSHYSDGFGASFFVRDDSMLLLTSNHELLPVDALESEGGSREAHWEVLFAGLPEEWSFVRSVLQEQRFLWNQPTAAYWLSDGTWHTTELLSAIQTAAARDPLSAYAWAYKALDENDLGYIFSHAGRASVDAKLLEAYFSEWKF